MTEEQKYPAKVIDMSSFIEHSSKEVIESTQSKQFFAMTASYLNKELIRKLLKPALDFMVKISKPLYCGEYGVIFLIQKIAKVSDKLTLTF